MSLDELKDRARQGDQDALRELRDRGFFRGKDGRASYPASDAQRRLWVLDQMNPASASYNVPGALRIAGALDEDAFARALAALVVRHDSLRTCFAVVDGEVRQVVDRDASLPLGRVSLIHHADPEAAARALVADAAARPFSLSAAPLVSASLLELAVDDHVFVFNIHHIVCDAWSLNVLFRELLTLYEAFLRGAANPLEPLRLQYKDVAAWQHRRLEEGEFEPARRHWLDQFAAAPPPLELPRDCPRPAVQTFDGGQVSRPIAGATTERLERLGAGAGATLFMTLLAAARVLLLRYTGQPDVVIGAPVSGRNHRDLDQQVGFYVNLLPLRMALDPTDSFVEVLAKVRRACGSAYEHEYPFDRLVDELDLKRDLSRSPLFDVLLTVEETAAAVPAPSGLRLEPFMVAATVAKYDLTFFFTRTGGALHLAINYNSALFRPERIETMARHFVQLLEALAAQPDACILDVPLADTDEAARVRVEFGLAPASYPRERSIAGVFEAQAAATPDADAVIAETADGAIVRLTYRQLDQRAARVADRLRALGVGLETPVGVLLERSERVAVALLGILKAGGCYVPLEASSPRSRVEYVVADARCRLVIAETATTTRLGIAADQSLGGVDCVDVDALVADVAVGRANAPSSGRSSSRSHGGNLAYVMYTSGSTGEPKGTLIDQRSVLRLVLGTNYLQLGPGDRMLQTGSLAFDASTLELWGPLLNGGAVCFAPGEDVVVAATAQALIARHGVTAMWVTASLLNQWVESGEDVFGRLRCLLTGGERLSPWHLARLRQRYPELVVINGYGPTENTTFTTCHRIDRVDEGDIPIGRPIANTSVLILDERGALCPVGIAGEICAGGDGLARGYLNRPELTAERFVPHPFAPGERVYRTGDLGRWRWDGTVEFLGRRDTQVKVRGYRIEPGEIEAQLLRHPEVSEACVIARAGDDGARELTAYFVSPSGLGSSAARGHLADCLPAYMVPGRFLRLERMPLTRNGKVDRAALPDPGRAERRDGYEAPRTPVERALCAIWSDVLQIGDVGVRDNFFELGGHSLKATRVLTRVHRELSERVTLRDLFACPDVASLAARIGVTPARRAAIPPAPAAETYPASHAQRRLWLLQRLSDDSGAYNVPGAVLLEGDLDPALLSLAFTRLVERHESLRTGFTETDGELCQRVLPPFAVDVPVVDVSMMSSPEDEVRQLAAADAAAPFVLAAPPLFRTTLFRLAPGRHVFFFNLHHIVTDGWSMRVLLGELLECYRAALAGTPDSLPPLAVQYRDYAVWQRAELAGAAGQAHRQYWLDRFSDEVPALELPADAPRPSVQTFRGAAVRSLVDAATVAQLRRLGQEHGATLYMVLLAAVRVLLFRHARQEEFVIGTGVSGREHADLEGQVGFYVNMLPLRQRVTTSETFLDVLRTTRDTVAEALEHQVYPFDCLVGDLQVRRELGRQPMFDVVVTLEEEDAHTTRERPPSAAGPRVAPFDISTPFSKFDLMFAFGSSQDGPCTVALEYSSDLFEGGRIERMAGQFEQLLASVLRDAAAPVGSIVLLPSGERQLLARFAGAPTPYPSLLTIAAQFERQAERAPAAVAVVAGDVSLAYGELNARANSVAHALRARGVTLEDRVGVLLERSERIAVALLGILKAGGCYLPLEPGAPAERTDYMVADAGCRLIIDEAMLAELESADDPAMRVNPPAVPGGSARSLAYVMYTSGSTGQPKGTLIEQRSVLRLVLDANYLQLGPDDRVLQTGSLAFDASTLEIWGPLLNGGGVCFARRDELLDAGRVRAAIARYGITAMFVTTSLFNQLVDGDEEVFTGLRCLMTGGEKVSVSHINIVSRRDPRLVLLHVYGPTENTTFTTFYPVEGAHELDVPIGRPLSNTTVYILDEAGGRSPIGVPGEICTGGDGLARGYLNRPDLTAERFVPAFDAAERLYRTGDVGRWRADGAVEFVGRRDNQVKVHGYRVEPGEIEARLLQHPDVTQAAVLARETTVGTRELVAYYAGGATADVAAVRAHLAATLPAYMIPSAFNRLAQLPLNRNGKIDRGALAAIQQAAGAAEGDEAWEPPQTEEEQVLAGVWAAVLDRPRVGRGDHYFDAGGDSIRAIQIVNRLRKAGWTFDVREVFQHPVLSDAALRLTRAAPAATREMASGPIPLTPIQRWFFTRAGDLHHFNHAILLRCATRMREDLLSAAVTALVGHHVALRLAVSLDASGEPIAMTDRGLASIAGAACEVRDFREAGDLAWQQDMQAVQQAFDLAGGALFKAVWYRLAGGDRLLLVAHHLIIDGVSWRIVLEDLEEAYRALAAGETPALTPQAHSYADWAAALPRLAKERDWSADHAYWSTVCSEGGARRRSEDGDAAAGVIHTYGDCAAVEETLPAAATRALLEDVHAAFNTSVDDILLTALARAQHRLNGTDRTWIAMEGHGRDTVPGLDVSGTVGWFTSVYPFLLPLEGGSPRAQTRHVKEALRAARRHALGYTALRWLGASPPLDAPAPDCRISFNYMGQIGEAAADAGSFTLADDGNGEAIGASVQREHEFEVGGIVRGGRLTLSITFSRRLHTETEARRLLDALVGELGLLLAEDREAPQGERTPSDFTGCPLTLSQYDALLRLHGWHARDVEDVFPLTPMQEGLLFQSLLDASSRAYFLQLNYRMVGPLDVDRFRFAWHEVARRHAVLRAAIVHDGVDRPLQVILAGRRPEVRFEDLAGLTQDAREQRIDEWRRLDMARGVDLQHEPLMRIGILRLAEDVHHVVWSYHHVLLDGWSLGILYREFQELYQASGGAAVPALTPPQPFADYMRWLLQQDAGGARAYWAASLEGYAPVRLVEQLAAAADGPAAEGSGEHVLTFDRALSERMAETAAASGVTLNTLVQTLWAVLLARYTGARDVAFGAVVSGRPSALPGVEDMVGLFINSVPVRVQVDDAETLTTLLQRVQREAVAAEPFHFFPLADTQAAYPGGEIFDHLLVFENYPLERGAAAEPDAGAIRIEAFEAHDRTHYDLDLTIVPGEVLQVRFNHRLERCDAATVARLAQHFEAVAAAAVASPGSPVSALRTLSADEASALLAVGRGPRVDYPVDQTLSTLFEAQAAAVPHAIAARHAGGALSYAALNTRANQIARWLRGAGVGRGDFVALLEPRGLDLLAAMLGVLKAGGAFLPIDPEYPAERIQYMLADSGVRIVISRGSLSGAVSDGVRVLDLNDDVLASRPTDNLPPVSGPRDTAYLLYTSGSTGRPKGALVRQDGAVNHIYAEFDLLRFHRGTVFLQSAPSSSDISVWQFLAPGLIGARTVIADYDDVADPARLLALLRDQGVTLFELVPVVLKGLLDFAATLPAEARALPALEWAMVTGETVPVPLVNQWVAAYPHVPLVNAYGPTEAADDICQAVITAPLAAAAATVPIGRPLANLRLYVLDPARQLVPFGVAGEICVSGIGVGAGYWQDPARTAAAFVANPFAEGDVDATLYRTGDRGRWRADGTLECLGRLDQQVKIRGFRIELEEVESRLLEHPALRLAAAGVREVAGDPALVAWIVGEAPVAALREHLAARLPKHMVPSFFVRLEALPLGPSGKIDRQALPAPDAAGLEQAHDHEAPATDVERRIASIWRVVLQTPRVGRHDSFFDLGGHSLKAMQVVSRLHRDLGARITLQEFFAHPTVAALAALVVPGNDAFDAIAPIAAQPDYELSHAQKRLWLLHHLDGSVAYNMPEAVVLDEPVDRAALRRAFATLVERHEVLRTAFVLVDGEPRQRILDSVDLAIREVDLSDEADAAARAAALAAAEAAVPFDLTQPPLLRAVLFTLSPAREVFLMVIHHVIGDGWSMNVLYREVLALYDAYRHGRPDPLLPLRIQYKDFAAWQNRQDMDGDERYWLQALSGAPDRLALPYDASPDGDRDFRGGTEQTPIDAVTTARLQRVAAAHGTTLSNVVLAIFQLVLYQWTRQADVCVGLAIAGRNRPDLESLIGFFVNILPIRVQLSSEMEFSDLLALVKERTNEAFAHQDYPFDRLVQRLNPGRDGNRQPVLNVIYAFQNFEDVAIDIGRRELTPARAPVPGTGVPAPEPTALVQPFKVPFETSKFDLTLFVSGGEGELLFSLEYDSQLFRRETIRRAVATMARFAGMVR